jgi:hypothetical protein
MKSSLYSVHHVGCASRYYMARLEAIARNSWVSGPVIRKQAEIVEYTAGIRLPAEMRSKSEGGKEMAAHNYLEEIWGRATTHAEHHVGDYIRYSVDGQARSGTILWICAPVDLESLREPVRYVVQPEEESADAPDLILPGNILIGEAPKTGDHDSASVAELELALLEMFATLSTPIIIYPEIDDSGQPFYVWHIGESTPQQPWGLYVGMERHLIGALKVALERLLKHIEQQQPEPGA